MVRQGVSQFCTVKTSSLAIEIAATRTMSAYADEYNLD
jgi:hypothetical protein